MGIIVSKPFGTIPPVIISTASNFLTFFLNEFLPAAIKPIILKCLGLFFLIFLVSFELIA